MAYQIGAVILATAISAILYRLGGAAKKGNWLDFARNSKVRDIGCSLTFLALVGALVTHAHIEWASWWVYAICFGLSWASLSTYWDWLFGYDNYYMHGLGCGLAMLPLIACGVSWELLAVRVGICCFGMGLWSEEHDNDVIEELGRGALFIL